MGIRDMRGWFQVNDKCTATGRHRIALMGDAVRDTISVDERSVARTKIANPALSAVARDRKMETRKVGIFADRIIRLRRASNAQSGSRQDFNFSSCDGTRGSFEDYDHF